MTHQTSTNAGVAPDDRRSARRVSPSGDARAKAEIGDDVVDCRVIDLSAGGAKLWLSDADAATGELVLNHAVLGQLRGECVWRGGDYVGIRFRQSDLERFADAADREQGRGQETPPSGD